MSSIVESCEGIVGGKSSQLKTHVSFAYNPFYLGLELVYVDWFGNEVTRTEGNDVGVVVFRLVPGDGNYIGVAEIRGNPLDLLRSNAAY